MSNNRHHCTPDEVCTCAPSEKDLKLLGFQPWQIALCKQLPPELQWEAHDEFIRRLMSNDDVDTLAF